MENILLTGSLEQIAEYFWNKKSDIGKRWADLKTIEKEFLILETAATIHEYLNKNAIL